MGTVGSRPSEAQLEGLTSSSSGDRDAAAFALPRGMRPAGARAVLSVPAQEEETAREEPRGEPPHTPFSKLTVC